MEKKLSRFRLSLSDSKSSRRINRGTSLSAVSPRWKKEEKGQLEEKEGSSDSTSSSRIKRRKRDKKKTPLTDLRIGSDLPYPEGLSYMSDNEAFIVLRATGTKSSPTTSLKRSSSSFTTQDMASNKSPRKRSYGVLGLEPTSQLIEGETNEQDNIKSDTIYGDVKNIDRDTLESLFIKLRNDFISLSTAHSKQQEETQKQLLALKQNFEEVLVDVPEVDHVYLQPFKRVLEESVQCVAQKKKKRKRERHRSKTINLPKKQEKTETKRKTKQDPFERRPLSAREVEVWDIEPMEEDFILSSSPGSGRLLKTSKSRKHGNTPNYSSLTFGIEEGKEVLLAGEIMDIFEYVMEVSHNASYMELFFITYRDFTTAVHLLSYLYQKCEDSVWSSEMSHLVAKTINFWATDFPTDFLDNETSVHLERILEEMGSRALSAEVRQIQHNLMMIRDRVVSVSELAKITVCALSLPYQKLELLSAEPSEWARQFTLLESAMYQNINPLHILQYDPKTRAPEITTMIDRFNLVCGWVATEILKHDTAKKRASIIKYFILIADACKDMRNFNTLLEISAGLNLAVIQRLKKTWKLIPSKYMDVFHAIEELMECHANYRNYRCQLKECDPPACPYLGIFLKDIVSVEFGNETFDEKNLVNFEKLKLKGEIVRQFRRWQCSNYAFGVSYQLQNYLQNLSAFDETSLIRHSAKQEPPAEV